MFTIAFIPYRILENRLQRYEIRTKFFCVAAKKFKINKKKLRTHRPSRTYELALAEGYDREQG